MGKDEKNSGCMMGSNWWIYVLCIIGAIIFIILVIWISSYWSKCDTIPNYCLTGKAMLMDMSNNSVPAANV